MQPLFLPAGAARFRSLRHLLLVLALGCAACAPRGALPPALPPGAAAPWWADSGDATLDAILARALPAGEAPVCPPAPHGLGLFAGHHTRAVAREAVHAALVRRMERARTVALAYAQARRWQAMLALREAAPDGLRDDARIARFRREAGLAPGLDEDLAGAMIGLDGAGIDRARAGFETALAALTEASGLPVEDLRTRFATPSPWIDAAASTDAMITPMIKRRDTLAGATDRALAAAQLGYRNGLVDFATLFAAEAAALAAHEAQADARIARAETQIRQWHDAHRGETALRTLGGQGPGCD